MDTAMRDLEQIQERDDDLESRRMVAWGLAILTTLAVVLSVATALSRETGGGEPTGDAASRGGSEALLASLGEASRDDAARGATSEDEPRAPLVDPASLRFPEALADVEERPEVAAALAAAEAELALPPTGGPGDRAPGPSSTAGATGALAPAPIARQLPAAHAAQDPEPGMARVVRGDPLLSEAEVEEVPPSAPAAPGHEGELTLQVVSYETRERAEAFAEELQARGHRAFVMSADVPGRGRFHRVRIGPFDKLHEAESYRRRFEAEEQIATFIVRRPAEE